jgi:hypothetical protein
MTSFPSDVGGAVEAYAAYLNAPRGVLDSEEQLLFDEDMARARAAMERAWLEATPVREHGPAEVIVSVSTLPRWLDWLSAVGRMARRALARA